MRLAKDTQAVRRCIVHYRDGSPSLKIEVSYRDQTLQPEECPTVNGVKVYPIGDLAGMKAVAYMGRDRLRDLCDLSFICKKYFEDLPEAVVKTIRNCVANKGIEQFDYMLATQDDPLVDKEQLAEDFLAMHERLGLMSQDVPFLLSGGQGNGPARGE